MRLIEFILGLDKGFLSRQGDWRLEFNPHWPGQQALDSLFHQVGWGATLWNLLLGGLLMALVLYVYWHEGRGRSARISLGILRGLLLALVLVLLNNPVLTLYQSRTEPSVLAIMLDHTISMRVRDGANGDASPQTRLEAAVKLLTQDDQSLVRDLAKRHILRFYEFDRDAKPLADVPQETAPSTQPSATLLTAAQSLEKLKPDGQSTQVAQSLRTVLDDLQGQRIAGVVVLTDGRDTPKGSDEALQAVKSYGVKVYPVAIGSDQAPRNLAIQGLSVQDAVFQGDIVNVKATIRVTGYEPGHPVQLLLKDKKTGAALKDAKGGPVEVTVPAQIDRPQEVELPFKPEEVGPLDLVVEVVKQDGELDDEDNTQTAALQVLDTKLTVLYVDGYPRWEYRYLKDEMIRDKTIQISCLLTSADPSFAQEGTKPIKRFPESIQELMDYDVVVFGDVDPRQFTDYQLQLVSEFVSKKAGGFGMVAGPRWSPQAFRNTAIEPLLPVNISRVESTDESVAITQGFRPVLTKEGSDSTIFRFFTDKKQNEDYLKDGLQPIFWYCRGITVKPGVGEVYAEHPSDVGPDGRKSPILVFGRFGAGRTMFSAIDDSWRWRFYTGESIFDTYWLQQLRQLARERKLGQRQLTFTTLRPVYTLGEQVQANVRILDPQLQQQLPESLRIEVVDEQGQLIRQEDLVRQEGQRELYQSSFTADRVGAFTLRLPAVAGGDPVDLPIRVIVPRLELDQPQVDRTELTRLASETLGKTIEMKDAAQQLPTIASAAKFIPVRTSQPLWDAPLAMAIFVLLITAEWILRKGLGML